MAVCGKTSAVLFQELPGREDLQVSRQSRRLRWINHQEVVVSRDQYVDFGCGAQCEVGIVFRIAADLDLAGRFDDGAPGAQPAPKPQEGQGPLTSKFRSQVMDGRLNLGDHQG